MENERREQLIDTLLVVMNEEIEKEGALIGNMQFSFSPDGEDLQSFVEQANVSAEEATAIVNACLSRQYLARRPSSRGIITRLTEEGQGRAISVASSGRRPTLQSTSYTIGSIQSSGQLQVGDGNLQQVEANFASLIQKIDESEAPDPEKTEAKTRLKSLLSHPLVIALLGDATSHLVSML